MHFTQVLSGLALASICAALSGHVSSGHDHHLARRHSQLARRAHLNDTKAKALLKRRAGPARLNKRKVVGEGDSTKEPANLAQGSATAADGCKVWHTVSDGEVCLGLIDKSSSGFNMAKFLKMNPSLNSDCSNLVTGVAYCVDTVVGSGSSSTATASTSSTATASTNKAVAQPDTSSSAPRVAAVSTSSSPDDTEDCEEEEEPESTTDDGDDCDDDEESTDDGEEQCEEDEEDDSTSTSASVSVKSDAKKQAPSSSDSNAGQQSSNDSGDSSDSSDSSGQDQSQGQGSSTGSSSQKQSSGNANQFSGTATWYTQNGNAGNCGQVNPDSAHIVALFTPQYENGAHCGKQVQLTNTANGNSITATVADSCPSCEKVGNIDLSTSVFSALSDGNMGLGVLQVNWGFV